MSLDSYTNLKTEVADWLGRSDLTSVIPTFITLAEAEMKRRIRKWTTRNAAFTVNAARMAVASDFVTPRSIRFISASGGLDKPLRVGTIEQLNERKARQIGATSRPDTAAYVDGYLYFAPEPDQTYTAELFYFSQFTALSSLVASNSVLTEAPDAYLFGALMHAEPYLEHDERITTWKAAFNDAIEQLNALREEAEHTASIRDVRLPVVFG